MSQVENALTDARIEYVAETTEGTPPDNPSWSVLTDYLQELSFSPGPNRGYQNIVGAGSTKTSFRGAEEPSFTTDYYKQQGFVDSNGDGQYPAADPLVHDYSTEYPSYTFEHRQEKTAGGNFSSGFREYFVAFGAKQVETSAPGDPSSEEPIVESLSWECQRARPYVIHQPDSSTTLDVTNGGSNSVDVTIEDEGAGTTETVTVSGGSTVTTTNSFADIDVIWAESEPDGDISVTDGSGTTVLDQPLAGSDTDNVEGEQGVPPLGTGSHGSAIGTSPHDYLFIGTELADWDGSDLSSRIHTLDLTVSVDTSREAKQGSRGTAIDIGPRTVETSADTAGPYETATRIQQMYRNKKGDFVYHYPDNDVTIKNASMSDAPDYTRSAGDTNYIPSATFRGEKQSDAADVVVTYTGP